jgi:hypothetical protein
MAKTSKSTSYGDFGFREECFRSSPDQIRSRIFATARANVQRSLNAVRSVRSDGCEWPWLQRFST